MAHEHFINADERLDVGAKHAKTNKSAATPSKAGAVLQALVWVDNEGSVAVADHLVPTACWLMNRWARLSHANDLCENGKKKNLAHCNFLKIVYHLNANVESNTYGKREITPLCLTQVKFYVFLPSESVQLLALSASRPPFSTQSSMNRMAIQALEKMETRKFKAKGKGPSESSCGASDSLSGSSTSDCAICLEKYMDGEVRRRSARAVCVC